MVFDKKYKEIRFVEDKNRSLVWEQIVLFLNKYLRGKVVDVGCGYGDFLRFVRSSDKIGIDVIKYGGFPESARFINDSVQNVSNYVKNADVVFCSNLLEHFDRDELNVVLESIHSSLKKGGLLIVMQPNFKYMYESYFDDYTHKSIFTHISLQDLLKSKGFYPVKIYPRFLPSSLKSKLPKLKFLVWLYLRSPIKPFAGQMLLILKKK